MKIKTALLVGKLAVLSFFADKSDAQVIVTDTSGKKIDLEVRARETKGDLNKDGKLDLYEATAEALAVVHGRTEVNAAIRNNEAADALRGAAYEDYEVALIKAAKVGSIISPTAQDTILDKEKKVAAENFDFDDNGSLDQKEQKVRDVAQEVKAVMEEMDKQYKECIAPGHSRERSEYPIQDTIGYSLTLKKQNKRLEKFVKNTETYSGR